MVLFITFCGRKVAIEFFFIRFKYNQQYFLFQILKFIIFKRIVYFMNNILSITFILYFNNRLIMKFNILCFVILTITILSVTSQATVKQIKGLLTKNLVFSGNLSVSATSQSQLFFTYYGVVNVLNRAQLAGYPTLVVFGSPGSSSQYLNFGSMGPLLLAPNLTLTANANSPTAFANIMFVDHLGSGFSFARDLSQIPDTYAKAAQQISYALGEFTANIDFGAGNLILVGQSSWIRMIQGFSGNPQIKGVVSISAWPELNAIGKYAATSGVELNIFPDYIRIEVESNYVNCGLLLKNGKYLEAHQCYDSTLKLVQDKTQNHNLFNVKLNSTLIGLFAQVQYYLTLSASLNLYSAPTSQTFQQQSLYFQSAVYVDQAKNYTQNISQFLKDNSNVKALFIAGTLDYLTYYKAIRNWAENELSFSESAAFKAKSLDDITVDGKVVGRTKSVNQVGYIEILDAGHYSFSDQGKILVGLLQNWVGGLGLEEQIIGHIRIESEY